MGKLNRKMGVRVGFVLIAVICYFATLAVLVTYPGVVAEDMTWSALEWLIGAIGAAVLGDTVRPSGMTASAFRVARATGAFPAEDEDTSDV